MIRKSTLAVCSTVLLLGCDGLISHREELVAEGEFDRATYTGLGGEATVYFLDGRTFTLPRYSPGGALPWSTKRDVVSLEYRWGYSKVYERGTRLRILFDGQRYRVEQATTPFSPTPACVKGVSVNVPAKPNNWQADVLTPTKVQLQAGDRVQFAANGVWSVGLGPIGPDGAEDLCDCTVSTIDGRVSRGSLGALIGRIGVNGTPFLIGAGRVVTVREAGTLYLGVNDNMEPCSRAQRGSCYGDNRGAVDVCIDAQPAPESEQLSPRATNERRPFEASPLGSAIRHQDIQRILWLGTQNANLNEVYKDGTTALNEAVKQQDQQLVKFLLDMGADVNARGESTRDTALIQAVRLGRTDIAALLLSRGAEADAVVHEINAVGTLNYGYPTATALSIAIEAGNTDLVQLLLTKGADPSLAVRRRFGSGFVERSPRELAAARANSEIRNLLDTR